MSMKENFRRSLSWLPPSLVILAFVHPVAKLFARWDWRLDLLSHFQEQALAMTALAVIVCYLTKRRSIVLVLLFLAAYQAEPVFRLSFPSRVKPADPAGPRLRILMANVLVDNGNYEALSRLIRETNPDIVGLVEVSDAWVAGLSEIAREYPYRLDQPNEARGLSLWFKEKPISIDRARSASPDGWPFLHATFRFQGSDRHLWLVHPASPFRRRGKYAGFPELDALSRIVAIEGGSRIVFGDLNTTDGSPYFRDFLAVSGLRDSRQGFGRQVSWPVGSPVQLAIDHAFVSEDWAVVERKQADSIGSDHRPFWFELAPSASSLKKVDANDSASIR